MKKIIFASAILLTQTVYSQVSLSGNKFLKDGKTYKISQYDQVFQKSESLELLKKAKTNRTTATVLCFGGGFSLGFGIAQIIAHGKTKTAYDIFGNPYTIKPRNTTAWTMVAIGGGLVAIAIPVGAGAKKDIDEAIKMENGTTAFQPYFKIENSGGGLALSYNF